MLVHPAIVTLRRKIYMDVNITLTENYGLSQIYEEGQQPKGTQEVEFVETVDAAEAVRIVVDSLKSWKGPGRRKDRVLSDDFDSQNIIC